MLPSLRPYNNFGNNENAEMANRGYDTSEADESGINSSHYSVIDHNNINLHPAHLMNQSSSILDTSVMTFDLMNANANSVKTRYDVRSAESSSLYGSKKSLPGLVSINTNGRHTASTTSSGSMSKKIRLKEYVKKKIFSDDDSYASGEYEKDTVTETTLDVAKKDHERETWGGRFDFFLSCLGYAIGLGAVWRFPYLCYKNGGGVFLIPYFIFLFFVGIPLFCLELNLGQFTNQGPILCWGMAPIFKGIGISMNIASFYLCIYYNMIIAYSLYFLFMSFRSKLAWTECDYTWASLNCTDDYSEGKFIMRCDQADQFRDTNGLCYTYSGLHGRTPVGWWDIKKRLEYRKPIMPSEDYFNNYILQKSPGLEDSGQIVWQLALSLFIAWVIVFLCVFKGIKSSGKVVYFTALFPFVVLGILGVRGWMLEGAGKGIEFYLKPDISKLLDADVWFDAAVQIFFTMSTGYGGLITLASYNKFNQNTVRNAFVITLSNAATSIFAGFVVFAYIGHLGHVTHQEIKDVVSSGSGLAFVVFPFAVTQLSGAPFWAIIFFIMMLTLGLDSEFATLETCITSFLDVFPRFIKYKTALIAVFCAIMFALGLPYCTRGGQYWIEMMDKYSGGWAILMIGVLECICIGWVYGPERFQKDMTLMMGNKTIFNRRPLFWYWYVSWKFFVPIMCVGLIIFSWYQYKPLTLGSYSFPAWTNIIGWLMGISVITGFNAWAIYCIFRAVFITKEGLKSCFQPEASWGPLRAEHKRLAIHLSNLEHYHESKRVKRLEISTLN